MQDRELIVYRDALNDAREELLKIAEAKLSDGQAKDAIIIAECSQAIAKLREKI